MCWLKGIFSVHQYSWSMQQNLLWVVNTYLHWVSLKHLQILFHICCHITHQTLIWLLLWCFCLVIAHITTLSLSLCRERETAAGESSHVAGGDAAETTHQSHRDNDWSSWLPYRTSVKLSFVSTAFLCIVLFALLNQTLLISFPHIFFCFLKP